MNNEAELNAPLYCVADELGNSHFTTSRQEALATAEWLRDLRRESGATGVQNVQAHYFSPSSGLAGQQGSGLWLRCRLD